MFLRSRQRRTSPTRPAPMPDLTDVDKGYYLESLTEKGDAILALSMIEAVFYEAAAQKTQKEAADKVKNPFPAEATEKVNAKLFDTDEFWQQVAAKCISCRRLHLSLPDLLLF